MVDNYLPYLKCLLNKKLGNLKYSAGSLAISYNSANQMGSAIDISSLNVSFIYCAIATINYTQETAFTIQKTDRIVITQQDTNRISIYAYADDNDYSERETLSVSWLIGYV